MKLLLASCVSLICLAAAGAGPSDSVARSDRDAIDACLQLAKTNNAARGLHFDDALSESPGAQARLAAASAAALRSPSSCLGMVANACIQKEGESNGTRIQCYEREKAVWDERLNADYKRVTRDAEPDVRASYNRIERAWIAYRDARCAHPEIEFKGSMAGPMQAFCGMQTTALQAIWLAGRD